MFYTMLTAQDLATNQTIDIVKAGSTYNVEFTNNTEFISVKFKTLKEAQEKYLKIIDCFINGIYTFEQRKNIILKEFKNE